MRNILLRVRSPLRRRLISLVVWLLGCYPKHRAHWVGRRPPHLLYLSLYVFILYTVAATVILIAVKDMNTAVFLFSAFVVPLYFVIRRARAARRS
jgi:hypothetical protein